MICEPKVSDYDGVLSKLLEFLAGPHTKGKTYTWANLAPPSWAMDDKIAAGVVGVIYYPP